MSTDNQTDFLERNVQLSSLFEQKQLDLIELNNELLICQLEGKALSLKHIATSKKWIFTLLCLLAFFTVVNFNNAFNIITKLIANPTFNNLIEFAPALIFILLPFLLSIYSLLVMYDVIKRSRRNYKQLLVDINRTKVIMNLERYSYNEQRARHER